MKNKPLTFLLMTFVLLFISLPRLSFASDDGYYDPEDDEYSYSRYNARVMYTFAEMIIPSTVLNAVSSGYDLAKSFVPKNIDYEFMSNQAFMATSAFVVTEFCYPAIEMFSKNESPFVSNKFNYYSFFCGTYICFNFINYLYASLFKNMYEYFYPPFIPNLEIFRVGKAKPEDELIHIFLGPIDEYISEYAKGYEVEKNDNSIMVMKCLEEDISKFINENYFLIYIKYQLKQNWFKKDLCICFQRGLKNSSSNGPNSYDDFRLNLIKKPLS